jgi:ferrochelatase
MSDDFQWSLIDRWNTHPGYLSALSARISMGLDAFPPAERDRVIIMFSAHSVPMKVVYKGDAYTKEIASTAEHLIKHMGLPNAHVLSWQSKGTPMSRLTGWLVSWDGSSHENGSSHEHGSSHGMARLI